MRARSHRRADRRGQPVLFTFPRAGRGPRTQSSDLRFCGTSVAAHRASRFAYAGIQAYSRVASGRPMAGRTVMNAPERSHLLEQGLNCIKDFPVLSTSVHGKPLVYLDNGATTQKPACVIDAESQFYRTTNANIH